MKRILYAITLSWNRKDDTLQCLSSFQHVEWPADWDVRTILVDNQSTDDTVATVSEAFPHVDIIQNKANLGFARGANRGLRRALEQEAEAIFLFNNDTLFDVNLGVELLSALEEDVAAVAPAIFYAYAPERIWSIGGGRSRWTLEVTGNHGRDMRKLPAAPFDQAFLTGCALLLNSRALREIGLFDEQFFMYYEDNDWALRATRAGFRLRVAPSARLWHKEAQSSGGLSSPHERFHTGRASVQFFRKHVRGLQWLVVVPYRLASGLKTSIQLAHRGQGQAVRSYWQGIVSGILTPVEQEGIGCDP